VFEPPAEGSYAGWLAAVADNGDTLFSLELSGAGVAVPTNTIPPRIDESWARSADGSWTLGGELVVDPGTWAGYAPQRLSFEWQRCDPSKPQCSRPVPGGPKYVLGRADAGQILRVTVRASNQSGRGNPASADTALVKFGR
jgi:hypothetical protein